MIPSINAFSRCLIIGLFCTLAFSAAAQTGPGSDELFQQARTAAFDQKDYPKAIALSQQALQKSPDYAEIRTFLGRIYTWRDQLDSARYQFDRVLQADPRNRDALEAYTNLEYWNNRPEPALTLCNKALGYYPDDITFQLKKVRILDDLKRYEEAFALVSRVVEANPGQADARALADRIRVNASKNAVTVGYDYLYFNTNYNDALHKAPWHVASLAYGRTTGIGSVIGRLNYANRFSDNGFQVEVDAYPRISRTFYSYVNAGVSPDEPVFPRFRAGFSLYANLPKSFEGEVGFRYLRFSGPTWIYTASVGKYYSNFWFNLRTYLVPGNGRMSESLVGTIRYYFGGADDYLSLGGGSGLSPDDSRNVLLGEPFRNLVSHRINAEYRRSIRQRHIVTLSASWLGQQQPSRPQGHQFSVGWTYQHRF